MAAVVETYCLPVAMVTSSRSPSENGSVISNESGKPSSGRRSPQNVMAQQKVTKEEARKRNGEKPSRQEPPSAPPTRAHTHGGLGPSVLPSILPRGSAVCPWGYPRTRFSELLCPTSSAPCSYGIVWFLRKNPLQNELMRFS